MSENGPKFFTNKPKKANLRPVASATMSESSSTGTARATPPPPPPPKESFARRYKFVWPVILAVNFAIGAYLLTRARKKDKDAIEETTYDPVASPIPPPVTANTAITENQASPPMIKPAPRPAIPDDLQRDLYRWMLEEKRRVKPVNREEKKRINEEKALLKHFIKAGTLPSL